MKTRFLRHLGMLAVALAVGMSTLSIAMPAAQAAGWTLDPNGGRP